MDISRLLRELHAERRWLECLIGALEAAAPASEPVQTLASRLYRYGSEGRMVTLGPAKKAELARLARRIRPGLPRHTWRHAPGPRLVRSVA